MPPTTSQEERDTAIAKTKSQRVDTFFMRLLFHHPCKSFAGHFQQAINKKQWANGCSAICPLPLANYSLASANAFGLYVFIDFVDEPL